jgi:hypothetical protein
MVEHQIYRGQAFTFRPKRVMYRTPPVRQKRLPSRAE